MKNYGKILVGVLLMARGAGLLGMTQSTEEQRARVKERVKASFLKAQKKVRKNVASVRTLKVDGLDDVATIDQFQEYVVNKLAQKEQAGEVIKDIIGDLAQPEYQKLLQARVALKNALDDIEKYPGVQRLKLSDAERRQLREESKKALLGLYNDMLVNKINKEKMYQAFDFPVINVTQVQTAINQIIRARVEPELKKREKERVAQERQRVKETEDVRRREEAREKERAATKIQAHVRGMRVRRAAGKPPVIPGVPVIPAVQQTVTPPVMAAPVVAPALAKKKAVKKKKLSKKKAPKKKKMVKRKKVRKRRKPARKPRRLKKRVMRKPVTRKRSRSVIVKKTPAKKK